MAWTSNIAATIAVAGMLTAGAAVASAATAAADPPPPPPADATDPVAPPPQGLNDVLASPVTSILGNPAPPPGTPGAPMDLLLSQYQTPSVPGETPPPLDLNTVVGGSTYLLPQNYSNPVPGQGTLYGTAPGTVTDQPSLIPALQGAHGLWHGAMGRLTPDQLGEPLPGTAPPPGTNIPPGLGEDLPNQAPAPFLPAPLLPPPGG